MRSIILAGATRSGKTTAAIRLHKEIGGSIIAGDILVNTFDKIYPELGIKRGIEAVEETSKNLSDFLSSWLQLNDNNSYRRFILDIYHLLPSQAVQMGMNDKYNLVFFGYPSINIEDKIFQIRNFPNKMDWTTELSDERLRQIIIHQIEWSRRLQRECAEFDIRFIDISTEFEKNHETAYLLLKTNSADA